jgi:hypothetical protein
MLRTGKEVAGSLFKLASRVEPSRVIAAER